jgi:hypothetical protein
LSRLNHYYLEIHVRHPCILKEQAGVVIGKALLLIEHLLGVPKEAVKERKT